MQQNSERTSTAAQDEDGGSRSRHSAVDGRQEEVQIQENAWGYAVCMCICGARIGSALWSGALLTAMLLSYLA